MVKKRRPRYHINFNENANFLLKRLGFINGMNQIVKGRNLSAFFSSLLVDWVRKENPKLSSDMDETRILARLTELSSIKASLVSEMKTCAMELNNLREGKEAIKG